MGRKGILVVALATMAVCLASAHKSDGADAARDKIALRVLYVGHPGTEREKDFVGFLEEHFAKVGKGDLEKVEQKDAEGFAVVVLDFSGLTIKGNMIMTPRMPFGRSYSRPVVTIGAAGALVSDSLGLKTGYLWNCLGEAAQGELPKHEVFEKPFEVKPVYEMWETPSSYRRYPGGKELPEKVKVWRIQKTTDKPGGTTRPYGAVSRDWKSDKKLDAEALVAGYNKGKMNGAVAVGRHGNFLQWGFSAPPSKMTDAGRRFFLNCICYIAKFGGKSPFGRT